MEPSRKTLQGKNDAGPQGILRLLEARGEDAERLFERAARTRDESVGRRVYLRGLIELSNVCRKNCRYCGIRRGNAGAARYTMPVEEVLGTAQSAYKSGLRTLVLQSGELQGARFTRRISSILKGITDLSSGEMHVTLSCGEQPDETYREWLGAGADGYLLRIESSDPGLYRFLHPRDETHSWSVRRHALETLRDLGYLTGTGVMIGLPNQGPGQLAGDLAFFRESGVDMIGMGPYVEHPQTPFYRYRHAIPSAAERFRMTRKMVAVLRILVPDINIAATTASEAILPQSRGLLIRSGANVVMPNLTPLRYQSLYSLYRDKPVGDVDFAKWYEQFDREASGLGYRVVPGEWGAPPHFRKRIAAGADCFRSGKAFPYPEDFQTPGTGPRSVLRP